MQPWLSLPNLQALASQGFHVDRCYTSSPECVPARASWLSGKKPAEIGVTRNQSFYMPPDSPSFVRNLRDNHGYTTSIVGKTHWTPHEPGLDLRDNISLMNRLGFEHVREIAGPRALAVVSCELTDLWKKHGVYDAYCQDLTDRYQYGRCDVVRPTVLPDELYPDLWLTNIALEEISRLRFKSTWFLWVSYPGPHEPFDVPCSWRRSLHEHRIPDPIPRPSDKHTINRMAPLGSALRKKIERWPDGLELSLLHELRADYVDHLMLLDYQVGRLMNAVSRESSSMKTEISVCSDHGELLGDWGLLLKSCFLEGAIRSLFLHKPARHIGNLERMILRKRRAYGLTELLWLASDDVVNRRNFAISTTQLPRKVTVQYGSEEVTIV